jgi:hypothetical protein
MRPGRRGRPFERRVRSMLSALAGGAAEGFEATRQQQVTAAPVNPERAAAFTPGGSLSEADCRRLVEETSSFREHGFLIIPDALSAEQLARVQAAYNRVTAPFIDEWEASSCKAGHDVPRALEKEEALLELIEHPRVLPLLSQVIGEDVQIRQVQTRYIPGNQPRGATVGYTGWQ